MFTRIFLATLFAVVCFFVQSVQQVAAQDTTTSNPTFIPLGDCQANANCPSPEPTIETVKPTNEPIQTVQQPQQQVDQVDDQNKNDLIHLIQRLIDLIKQLLGGGGGSINCPDTESNYAEGTIEANHGKGKKKDKKDKKGLLKRIKCPGQHDGGQQSGGGTTNPQPTAVQPEPTDPPQTEPDPTEPPQTDPTDPPQNQPEPTDQPEPSAAPTAVPSQAGGLGACTGGPQATEPAHNYTRTTHGGKTVNQRTKVMLQIAEGFFGSSFTLTQGSYNTGVAASAGTHDGGGVVDISVNGMSATQRISAARALRMAGFTAWIRTPAQGFAYHIHANAIGDREMQSLAMTQVDNFFDGLDGLAGSNPDTEAETAGRPLPSWAAAYGTCR